MPRRAGSVSDQDSKDPSGLVITCARLAMSCARRRPAACSLSALSETALPLAGARDRTFASAAAVSPRNFLLVTSVYRQISRIPPTVYDRVPAKFFTFVGCSLTKNGYAPRRSMPEYGCAALRRSG